MRLAGDPVDQPLSPESQLARTAALCLAAERPAIGIQPLYIMGGEVPLPVEAKNKKIP